MGSTSGAEHRLCFEQKDAEQKLVQTVANATEEAQKAVEAADKKKPVEQGKNRQADADQDVRHIQDASKKLNESSTKLPPQMQQGINTLQQTIGELNITDDAKEGIMKFVRLIMGLIQALQEAFPGMSGPEQKKEGAPGDTKPSEAAAGDGGKGTEKPKENVTSPSVSEKKETVSEKDLEAVQNPIKDAEELKVKIDALEQDIDKKDDDMRKQSEEERDAVNKLIKEWENMKQREKDLRSEHERRSTLMTSEKFPEGCIVRGVTLGQTSETDNDITFAFKAEGKDVSMIKQNLQNLLPA